MNELTQEQQIEVKARLEEAKVQLEKLCSDLEFTLSAESIYSASPYGYVTIARAKLIDTKYQPKVNPETVTATPEVALSEVDGTSKHS